MLYEVAPDTLFQLMVAFALPAVAVTPVGAEGSPVGVELPPPSPPPPQPIRVTQRIRKNTGAARNLRIDFIRFASLESEISVVGGKQKVRKAVRCGDQCVRFLYYWFLHGFMVITLISSLYAVRDHVTGGEIRLKVRWKSLQSIF
jgi:hypothetical protein